MGGPVFFCALPFSYNALQAVTVAGHAGAAMAGVKPGFKLDCTSLFEKIAALAAV